MNTTSIYCPDGNAGKTYGFPLGQDEPFFFFKMTHSGNNSKEYSNNEKVIINGSEEKIGLNGIITDFTLEKSESVSIASTLGSAMYLYVGGASPIILNLSGYAFQNCKVDVNGFESTLNWYLQENVSRTGGYCTLTIGTKVFRGYLIGFQVGTLSREALNLFRFKFKFIAVAEP